MLVRLYSGLDWSGSATRDYTGFAVEDLHQISNVARAASRVAYAAGKTRASNPYNRPAALPSATGEPFATWRARSAAWFSGWDEACVAKGGKPRLTRYGSRESVPVTNTSSPGAKPPTLAPAGSQRQWYIRDKSGVRRLTVFSMTPEEAERLFPGAEPGPALEGAAHRKL